MSADGCPVLTQAGLSSAQPEQPPAPPQHRPKPAAAPGKEAGSGKPAPLHHKQAAAAEAEAPHGAERRGRVQKQAADGRAERRPFSEKQNSPFLFQEAPVRDERGSGWSAASSDSEAGFQPPSLTQPGRRVEPGKPFSVSALSTGEAEEFGRLDPDFSDATVYNDLAQRTPGERTEALSCREPTPGSEAARRREPGPGPLFSELRQHQDSGFASPFHRQK